MHAESLLQGVHRIDEQGQQLLALRTFSGPEPSQRVDTVMTTLVDLAELLRASAPFPPRVERTLPAPTEAECLPDGGCSERTVERQSPDENALVRRLIERSYEQGPMTVDQLDPDTVDRVAAAERLATVDSWVIVPLSATAPYAHNWEPVVGVLLDRLDGIGDAFGQLARRARTGATAGPFVAGCEAVVEMLETLVAVVQRADANSRYVRHRTDHRQDELLSTIEDATTQLRSDNA